MPRIARAFSLRHRATTWLCVVAFASCAAPGAWALDFDIAINRGNGLANVFGKLSSGQSVTIAYIGGSVTQGWGWRDLTTSWFSGHYPGKVTEINAGWGGTGSLIGSMRYAEDVLVHSPDLVFVEFAVNDLPEDPILFIERNCEGFPLQAWLQDDTTDVCFIETLAWYLEGAYLGGNLPNTVQAHYNVCDHYGLPSVNVGWAMYEVIMSGTSWESLTANGDRVHPNAAGSQIYADALIAYLDSERLRAGSSMGHNMPSPLTDYPVTGGTEHDLTTVSPLPSGWSLHTNELGVNRFIQSSTAGSTITVTFDGPAAALELLLGPDDGNLSVSIDGGAYVGQNLAEAGHYFVWSLPIAKTLSFGTHTAIIRVDSGIARLIKVSSADSDAGGPGPDDVNLALTAPVIVADSSYGPGFTAEQARDGSVSTKWTSTDTSSSHTLTCDIGGPALLSTIIVKHAGTGGEPSYYNTQAFTIDLGHSLAGPWTTAFAGNNPNQLGTSTFSFASTRLARYVRLSVTDAGIDDFARIPEFEIWGQPLPAKGDMDEDGDVDQEDFGLFQACMTGPGDVQNDPACAAARLDSDGDVDDADFSIFTTCHTGADLPADPDCGYSY